jgi:hypothetical protein
MNTLTVRSFENYQFLDMIDTFKKTKNEKKRLQQAKKIFDDFISQNSQYQLNINQKLVDEMKNALVCEFPGLEPNIPLNFFDKVEKNVHINARDVLMRFIESKEYHAWALKPHVETHEPKGIFVKFFRGLKEIKEPKGTGSSSPLPTEVEDSPNGSPRGRSTEPSSKEGTPKESNFLKLKDSFFKTKSVQGSPTRKMSDAVGSPVRKLSTENLSAPMSPIPTGDVMEKEISDGLSLKYSDLKKRF